MAAHQQQYASVPWILDGGDHYAVRREGRGELPIRAIEDPGAIDSSPTGSGIAEAHQLSHRLHIDWAAAHGQRTVHRRDLAPVRTVPAPGLGAGTAWPTGKHDDFAEGRYVRHRPGAEWLTERCW